MTEIQIQDLPARNLLTITDLTSFIKERLEDCFHDIWVEGEISNLKIPMSGHIYLSLKDEKAQIKAIIFRSYVKLLKFVPKDGQHLICRGHITVYEPRGEYQIIIDYIEPKGIGSLQLAFEQLKDKLIKEGLFDLGHKKELPLFPGKIGIVTSPTGAAIRDLIKVLQKRCPNIEIMINPVSVQGEKAKYEIANAIKEFNEMEGIDLLIVGRGGGSLEDLWPFNEEIVARAIYNSKIPIISAVGHETDFTISDFVSDLRAPTPSAAAEMAVTDKNELAEKVNLIRSRLFYCMRNRIEYNKGLLREMGKGVINPIKRIEMVMLRIDDLTSRLKTGFINNIRRNRLDTDLENYSGRLKQSITFKISLDRKIIERISGKFDALNPLSILSRGFSIARNVTTQRIIKECSEVKKGDRVNLKLHKGELFCLVEDVIDSPEIL